MKENFSKRPDNLKWVAIMLTASLIFIISFLISEIYRIQSNIVKNNHKIEASNQMIKLIKQSDRGSEYEK